MTVVPADRARFWLGTGFIALTAASLGLVTTLARLAYDGGGGPATLVVLRFAGFVAIMGGFLLLSRRPMRMPARALAATGWIAVLTLMMSVGYLGSVAYIPVSLAAIILYTFPLMVGVLATLTGREPMTPIKAIALLGAFAGLTLAVGPTFSSLDPRGIGLALTAAVGVAIFFTYSGPIMRENDPLVMNFYTNLWMLAAAAAYVLVSGGMSWPDTASGVLAAAGATLCYLVGFIALFAGLRYAAPIQSAMIMNAEPPVSILAATLLLGERLTTVQLLGVALVLAAITATTLGGPRPERR